MDVDAWLKRVIANSEKKKANTNKLQVNREILKNTVTKSNSLARAYYRFSLVEKRCMEALISKLHPIRNDNYQSIPLTAKEYSEAYNVSLNNAYTHIAKAVDGLLHKVIVVKENAVRIEKINLTCRAVYEKQLGAIHVEFNPLIVPHLIYLREKFTSYPLKQAAPFTSSYTWRFYELLVSWAKPKSETEGYFAGWFKADLLELRKQLGVPESYVYGMFEKKVLDVVTTELQEKANIHVRIERIKTSRKITHLNIQFVENRVNSDRCRSTEEE